MPIIRVEMWEGRTTEQKRELVEILTKETARISKCDIASVYVIIEDVKKENWGGQEGCCALTSILNSISKYLLLIPPTNL